MKKIFLFLLIGFSLLSSCSSDDSSSAPENQMTTNGTKLLKAIMKDPDGNVIVTQEYEYQGNKLSRIIFPENKYHKIYYTGDFIAKMETYDNDVLIGTMYIEYNGEGKLSSTVSHTGSTGRRTTYIYNTDNTVTVTEYTGDLINQNTVVKNHKAFLTNGIITKKETYGSGGVTYTTDYTYDTNNNPLNGILGYGRLTQYEIGSVVSPNNLTQIIYSQSDIVNTGVSVSTFTYNSYNFPKTSRQTKNGVLNTTMEYYYAVQ